MDQAHKFPTGEWNENGSIERNKSMHIFYKRKEEHPMLRKRKQARLAATRQCTFCGKQQNQVERLIAGPSVFICNDCVALCQQLIQEGRKGRQPT